MHTSILALLPQNELIGHKYLEEYESVELQVQLKWYQQ